MVNSASSAVSHKRYQTRKRKRTPYRSPSKSRPSPNSVNRRRPTPPRNSLLAAASESMFRPPPLLTRSHQGSYR